MYYFIKHDNSKKPFIFYSEKRYKIGDRVICNTRNGEVPGDVLEYFDCTDSLAKLIAASSNAYWPLAQIIRKYEKPVVKSIDDVPAEIIEKIRRQELAKIIDQLQGEQALPFVL